MAKETKWQKDLLTNMYDHDSIFALYLLSVYTEIVERTRAVPLPENHALMIFFIELFTA
jgi:hypothetical protein